MAFDAFISIDGIDGESTDDKHQGWSEILSMSNCFISDYSVVGDGEDAFPIESTTIDYGKIQWVYTQQRREGGVAAGNIATGWNLETNSKV